MTITRQRRRNSTKAVFDDRKKHSDQMLPPADSTFESSMRQWLTFAHGSYEITGNVCHPGKIALEDQNSGHSLRYYNRVSEWDSPRLNVYNYMKSHAAGRYVITMWVSVDNMGQPDFNARMLIRGDNADVADSFIIQVGSNYFTVIGRHYIAIEVDNNDRIWYK